MEILITAEHGWIKPVKIEKAITRIGSSTDCDIHLDSERISPIHLQILYSADSPSSCKVLNLGTELSVIISDSEQKLAPYNTLSVQDGDEAMLDTYKLTFKMPIKSGVLGKSHKINAALAIADSVLRPGIPTTGRLTLKNVGEKPAIQFQVEVRDLPADCWQIDPIPLLYSGAEEDVRVQFFHRGVYPAAGIVNAILVVSAPESYPGEQITIQQGLYITPVFNQLLEVQDDLAKPVSLKLELPAILTENRPEVVMQDAGTTATPVDETPVSAITSAGSGEKEPVKARVVKNPSESYWDESSR